MPRDPNGKLYKRKLRDPYWEGRERARSSGPQPSIEIACLGQRRTASSIFGRSDSSGFSLRT